jgi:hypothetical protein
MPSRTTIIRLRDGSLVVLSPPPLVDASTVAAIDSIGAVGCVVLPNPFHYLYAPEFMSHYPAASLVAAPGFRTRVPELDVEVAELTAEPPAAWSGELEYVVLESLRGVAEVLFFHVPTSALILTDLAFNITSYPRALDRFVWRMSGIPASFGPGRTSRELLLADREAAARTLARAVDWPITRIVLAHGEVVDEDAGPRFRQAFAGYLARP